MTDSDLDSSAFDAEPVNHTAVVGEALRAPTVFPCRRCPLREGCELREAFKRRAAETGAISIAYHCSRLEAELRPGRRIVVMAPFLIEGTEWTDPKIQKRPVPATILAAAKRHEFKCVVDPGVLDGEDPNRFRFRKIQPHYRIVRFLDEPDLIVCSGGNIVRAGVCDANFCQCADGDRREINGLSTDRCQTAQATMSNTDASPTKTTDAGGER